MGKVKVNDIDEAWEYTKDFAVLLSFGFLALMGDFVGSLSEEAYLYGNAAKVVAGIAALVRAFVVLRDWQAKRDKIKYKRELRAAELRETRAQRNDQRRVIRQQEELLKPDLSKASSKEELSEILERHAREKLNK